MRRIREPLFVGHGAFGLKKISLGVSLLTAKLGPQVLGVPSGIVVSERTFFFFFFSLVVQTLLLSTCQQMKTKQKSAAAALFFRVRHGFFLPPRCVVASSFARRSPLPPTSVRVHCHLKARNTNNTPRVFLLIFVRKHERAGISVHEAGRRPPF